MKMDITIEKVELCNGSEFKGTPWKKKMQVIFAKEGLFIDNFIGNCFGEYNIMWKGIDWNPYVGQTVEIIVVNCVGKEITPSQFKPVSTIDELKRISGTHYKSCLNHNWAYPLFLLGHPKN